MSFKGRKFWVGAVLAVCIAAGTAGAQVQRGSRKYKAPPPTTDVTVTVLRASNGKPVANAAVNFEPQKAGEDNGSMEIKTNEIGVATLNDMLPRGQTVRVQVVADNLQTYGDDFPIAGDKAAIVIKLNPPERQSSDAAPHAIAQGQATLNGQPLHAAAVPEAAGTPPKN